MKGILDCSCAKGITFFFIYELTTLELIARGRGKGNWLFRRFLFLSLAEELDISKFSLTLFLETNVILSSRTIKCCILNLHCHFNCFRVIGTR